MTIGQQEVSQSFVPGDKNIQEPEPSPQTSIVNLTQESFFGLAIATEEVKVTNIYSSNKPLTKANIGL